MVAVDSLGRRLKSYSVDGRVSWPLIHGSDVVPSIVADVYMSNTAGMVSGFPLHRLPPYVFIAYKTNQRCVTWGGQLDYVRGRPSSKKNDVLGPIDIALGASARGGLKRAFQAGLDCKMQRQRTTQWDEQESGLLMKGARWLRRCAAEKTCRNGIRNSLGVLAQSATK